MIERVIDDVNPGITVNLFDCAEHWWLFERAARSPGIALLVSNIYAGLFYAGTTV